MAFVFRLAIHQGVEREVLYFRARAGGILLSLFHLFHLVSKFHQGYCGFSFGTALMESLFQTTIMFTFHYEYSLHDVVITGVSFTLANICCLSFYLQHIKSQPTNSRVVSRAIRVHFASYCILDFNLHVLAIMSIKYP